MEGWLGQMVKSTKRNVSQEKLDKWTLTADWLKYTHRGIFGNIIGAPEPTNRLELVDTAFKAIYLPAIEDHLFSNSILMERLYEKDNKA